MKHYMIEARIIDGEHEHRQFTLFKGKSLDSVTDKLIEDYFSYGDRLTLVKKWYATKINKTEYDTLKKLSIAFPILEEDTKNVR